MRPNFDMLVLELGCPPNVHHMSARVVNVIVRLYCSACMYFRSV